MSQYFLVSGDSSQARTYAQKAELIGAAFGDVELTAMAHYYLGWACHTAGDLQGAEDFIRKAIGDLQGAKDSLRKAMQLLGQEKMVQVVARLSATSRWSLAVSLGERGAFDEAITQAQQGVQLAETVGDAYSLVAGYWGLGHVCSLKGDLRQAGAMLERALALSRGWAFPIQSAYIGAQLGYVYALSARVVEGLALVRQALAALESTGVVAFHSLVVLHLSEVCRLADRQGDARAAAAQALSLARERGERGREADGLRLLGEVFARREPLDFEAADCHYTQALTLATQLGMRPLVAHCHLGLGKLAGRKSDSERAHEHLTTAAAMYREMGMDFWLAQAETALRSPGPEAMRVESRP
jgi:tetratricopeptide (TPR) repeat protein